MPSGDKDLEIRTHYLDPVRAEVRLRVPWVLERAAELRGRLMGPRCPFATTVEVAYPLRPMGSPGELQAIIPEPSLWEPQCPFLYEGPVEAWSPGELQRQAWVRHGLRTLAFGPRGLQLNGRPLRLRGVEVADPQEADLLRLRQKGYNALLAPAGDSVHELADRLGFLVLTRPTAAQAIDVQATQPVSHLGWVIDDDCQPTVTIKSGQYVGLQLHDLPRRRLPDFVSFLLVPARLAEELRPLGLPMMIRDDSAKEFRLE